MRPRHEKNKCVGNFKCEWQKVRNLFTQFQLELKHLSMTVTKKWPEVTANLINIASKKKRTYFSEVLQTLYMLHILCESHSSRKEV